MLRFALPVLLLLAACGGAEEPPAPAQDAPEPSAAADAVAGTYRLWRIDDAPLPGAVGHVDECAVELTEGRLRLAPDGTYELDVLARAVCDPDEAAGAAMVDRAMSEGPYAVSGSGVRFGSEVTRIYDEEAEREPDLFNTATFTGEATLRDTLLTVPLTDGLTTLTFVKR